MHQGKRLQSIAAFRINEGLTSWPLSPIYLLLWARYRSSTNRSSSARRRGSAKINLMKGKMRRVRRLRTSRAPSRSCIAGIRQVTRISQTTPLSSAAMFRFPHLGTPQSNSGAAGCGTIRILALSKGCISSAECLLMAHHGPAARCKPNVKLLHSDSRV